MADTTRNIYLEPAIPVLGAAGYQFTDPTFGTRMVRITDALFASDISGTNRSFHSSASAYQKEWNADQTKFFINDSAGNNYVVSFNPSTLATLRLGNALAISGDLVWDSTDPNILYGVGLAANHHTIVKVDTSTTPFTTSTFLNLDTITAGMTGSAFVGSLSLSNGNLFCIYGASQDTHMYCLWYPIANPSAHLVTNTMTRNGMDENNIHFGMHSAQIDKSGRYISMIPWGGTVGAFRAYIWDTTLDTIQPVRANSSGHEVLGFGNRINNDSIGSYDAYQWVFTPDLSAPNSNKREIINPLLHPQLVFAAEHSCWNHATLADPAAPFVSAGYRYQVGDTTPWRAWDQEVISIDPTNGTVYRHCHHRSRTLRESEPAGADLFWYTPRPNVSPDGKWVLFTSNWNKTLGIEIGTLISRQDVFLVERSLSTPPPAKRTYRHRTKFR